MKHLVVDACLNGTGIRDYYEGGYIDPESLNISTELLNKLNKWLKEYENEHFKGYYDKKIVNKLDKEGKNIAIRIKKELSEVKVQYYSDALTRIELI